MAKRGAKPEKKEERKEKKPKAVSDKQEKPKETPKAEVLKTEKEKHEKAKPVEEKPKEAEKAPEEVPEKPSETPKEEPSGGEEVKKEASREPKTTEDFIKLARERSKPRKFVQSWDLCINLKGLNLKKPENRFLSDFTLPEGRGKDVKIALFADTLASKAEEADLIIKKSEIDSLVKNKKKMKKIIREHDWFFGEATLMVQIGKTLGSVLAPRGKMPRPIPPNIDPNPLMLAAKNKVRIQAKESPVLHIPIGSDRMEDRQIAKNLEDVFNFVKEKLPRGRANIKSLYVKLTMGPAVRVRMK